MPLLRPMGQEMVDGVYALTEAPFEYPGSPENKAFYDNYKTKTGKFPSDYSVSGIHFAILTMGFSPYSSGHRS